MEVLSSTLNYIVANSSRILLCTSFFDFPISIVGNAAHVLGTYKAEYCLCPFSTTDVFKNEPKPKPAVFLELVESPV